MRRMSSAFRTFTSAAGIGSACYLLAMATWEQVLLLFLAASLGWCVFVWKTETQKAANGPRFAAKRNPEVFDNFASPRAAIQAQPQQRHFEPPRTIYRFPIHQLSNPSMP